jgi:hypothetical protein
MVAKMASPASNDSSKDEPPLSFDFELPVFRERMREHWPSSMSWETAMRWFDRLRYNLPQPFSSPEERLRDKNPERFRLP